MKIQSTLLVAAALALASKAGAQTPATAPVAATPTPDVVVKRAVESIAWLAGCWQGKSDRDGSTVNEVWFAPRGNVMMGIGQTYRDDKTSSWEAMRIYGEGESVNIWLHPGGGKEITLALDSIGSTNVAFALKEGETTTRLRYQLKNETEMTAAFRKETGENRRGADFSYAKVDCATLFAASPKTLPPAVPK